MQNDSNTSHNVGAQKNDFKDSVESQKPPTLSGLVTLSSHQEVQQMAQPLRATGAANGTPESH